MSIRTATPRLNAQVNATNLVKMNMCAPSPNAFGRRLRLSHENVPKQI
jgi:hypothetical protein